MSSRAKRLFTADIPETLKAAEATKSNKGSDRSSVLRARAANRLLSLPKGASPTEAKHLSSLAQPKTAMSTTSNPPSSFELVHKKEEKDGADDTQADKVRDVTELETIANELEAEKSTWEHQRASLNGENEKIKKENAKLTETVEALKKEKAILDKENASLRAAKAAASSMQSERDRLKARVAELEKKAQDMEKRAKEAETKVAKDLKPLQDLQKEIDDQATQLKEEKRKKEALGEKVVRLEERLLEECNKTARNSVPRVNQTDDTLAEDEDLFTVLENVKILPLVNVLQERLYVADLSTKEARRILAGLRGVVTQILDEQ